MSKKEKYWCSAQDAENMWKWIKERGGLAQWGSVDLSNPGITWTTPLRHENGEAYTKPHYAATSEPIRVITDPAEVHVSADKEVKRFRIGIRRASNGLSVKVTDGGTRRIRSAVAKAGEGAYYQFDYETQEAVIMAPGRVVLLSEWAKEKNYE